MLDLQNAATVLSTLGLGKIVLITPMEGGSLPVYRLETGTGTQLVLKLFPDGDRLSPRKDANAAAILEDLDLPVTRYLAVDETRRELPVRFAVTTYLPGTSLITFKGHPGLSEAFRQMGAALRRLHSVPMPGYGFFDDHGVLGHVPTNAELMAVHIPAIFTQFAALGGDISLAWNLRSIAARQVNRIVPFSRGAVFAHNDFQPGNVLFTETEEGNLSLTGIIDYGSVCAADAVSDLAKSLFCSEHDMPGSAEHILAGYGPIDHPDPAAALSFYTLIHRMIMWNTLRTLGVIATPDTPGDLIDALRQTALVAP